MTQPPSAPEWRSLSEAEIGDALAGCVSIEKTPDGLVPWRLRHEDRAFIPPDLITRVLCAAGVRLQLRTSATAVRLRVTPKVAVSFFAKDGAGFDLVIDGVHQRTAMLPEEGTHELLFEGLPAGEKFVEIFFPVHLAVTLHGVELSAGAGLAGVPRRLRWVTYGSSITHCRAAASPAFTWPALVARERGWNHWNMGYGGQCRFDPIVARTLRDMPADLLSLCLGINTAEGSYTMRTWRPAVEGFIMTVRDGHPTTPLLIISPIISPPREDADEPPCSIGLKTMRTQLEEIVATFRAAGDAQIHYLDGLRIIGHGDESTMPDELHPDADGIRLMASRFLQYAPDCWQNPRS